MADPPSSPPSSSPHRRPTSTTFTTSTAHHHVMTRPPFFSGRSTTPTPPYPPSSPSQAAGHPRCIPATMSTHRPTYTSSTRILLLPAIMQDLLPLPDHPKPNFGSSNSILKSSATLLLIYPSIGVLIYSLNPRGFSGIETYPAAAALYFCIVTFCTIGYGDITVSYVLDLQESLIIASARGSYMVDARKGRMRIRMKAGLAVGVVVLCIGAGTLALYFLED